jgi:hypothetical protein
VILEGIVTTLGPDGRLNVAPMGPRVESDGSLDRFTLRPFKTSTTYRNLTATGEGVLHVTDDVELLARAAIGRIDEGDVATQPARVVRGRVLTGACRYAEFRVTDLDDREDRTTIVAEAVATGRLRDFFGLNRAKHAVVEAAILATRIDFLPMAEILAQYRALAVLVEKTGGPAERAAFDLLGNFVRAAAIERGTHHDPGTP